jgi:hypothetical protein
MELRLNLESKVLRTARLDATLPIINPTCPEIGLYPSLCGKKTATNHFSSGTAFRVALELHSTCDFFFTFRGPSIAIFSYNKSQRVALFLNFIW